MKRATKLLFSLFISLIFLNSCYEREVFSEIPEIEFETLRYVDTDAQDSLILRFNFKDENADIGLNSDEILEPYNSSFGVEDGNGNIVTIEGDFEGPYSQVPISILPFEFILKDSLTQQGAQAFRLEYPEIYQRVGNSSFLSDDDPRPIDPACDDFVTANFYEVVDINAIYQELQSTTDDILIIENEFHHNFHIDFFRKVNGDFRLIDFEEIFNSCTDEFNGRIPLFDSNGREGFITYAMLSRGFRLAFLDDTIKAEFYVYDRELNKSNVAETEEFVLSQLAAQ